MILHDFTCSKYYVIFQMENFCKLFILNYLRLTVNRIYLKKSHEYGSKYFLSIIYHKKKHIPCNKNENVKGKVNFSLTWSNSVIWMGYEIVRGSLDIHQNRKNYNPKQWIPHNFTANNFHHVSQTHTPALPSAWRLTHRQGQTTLKSLVQNLRFYLPSTFFSLAFLLSLSFFSFSFHRARRQASTLRVGGA